MAYCNFHFFNFTTQKNFLLHIVRAMSIMWAMSIMSHNYLTILQNIQKNQNFLLFLTFQINFNFSKSLFNFPLLYQVDQIFFFKFSLFLVLCFRS